MSEDIPHPFIDKTHQPTEQDLAEVIGRPKVHWDTLKTFVIDEYGPLTPQWKFYTKKSGWTFVLRGKKFNLLYLSPSVKFFRAGFLYSEKAAAAAEDSNLPDDIKEMVATAKKYPEGRAIGFDVTNKKQVALIKRLIRIRMEV
jgi:hypothetical protein